MSPRIYYIANARMPTEKAHGIQLANMCEAFIKSGVDLRLIVPRRGISSVSLKEFYGLRVNIPIVRLPVLNLYRWGKSGYYIGSITFMISYVLYCWTKRLSGHRGLVYTIDLDQFSFSAVPFAGMPYVVEIHDAKQRTRPFRLLFWRARLVIAINGIIKRELMETFLLPDERIIVHPNGVDLGSFGATISRDDARRILNIPEDKRIVMYAGKCYSWKGMDTLIQGACMNPDLLFYLVGGTVEELKEATNIADIPLNIICVGSKPHYDVPVWLAAADVLLVLGTRKNDYSRLHTSPMKLFEYMASGRPIVASRTPANQEIVSEREVFFYEPDDAQSLSVAIKEAHTQLAAVLSKTDRAADKVAEWTWEKRANAIREYMEKQLIL